MRTNHAVQRVFRDRPPPPGLDVERYGIQRRLARAMQVEPAAADVLAFLMHRAIAGLPPVSAKETVIALHHLRGATVRCALTRVRKSLAFLGIPGLARSGTRTDYSFALHRDAVAAIEARVLAICKEPLWPKLFSTAA